MSKSYKGCTRIVTFALFIALAVTAAAQTKDSGKTIKAGLEGPMVFLQRGNYKVGETVRVSGQQFLANELVNISVDIKDLRVGTKYPYRSWTVYSDAKGYLNFDWKVPTTGSFTINVLGSQSKTPITKNISSVTGTPTPVFVSGNPSCATLNADNGTFPGITSDFGFKLDFGNPNGTFPFVNSGSPNTVLTGGAPADPGNSVTTVTTNSGRDLAWTSTRPITAVIVKGGPNGNAYVYSPESFGDAGPLTSPNPKHAISHVSFCHQATAKVTIIKHASPPSNFQFDFTTTGLATTNFSLVDNDISSDPMTMFSTSVMGIKTVTLTNGSPYSLTDIVCSVAGGGGSVATKNLANGSVSIDLKAGDNVTCTFVCDFVTAAEVTATGRVLDPYGRPLPGAIVSVTDTVGNTRSAMTNNFGYFRFTGLDAGSAYLFNITYKGYVFGNRVMTLDANASDLNFFAAPR